MLFMRSFKGFIITAAFSVSVLLFALLYLGVSQAFHYTVKENASTLSETLAQGTFNAMFQIMRQGWTRPQLEEFLSSLHQGHEGSNHHVEIFRGDKVTALFGAIEQSPIDPLIRRTFDSATQQSESDDRNVRFLYPLVAQQECLRCHLNVVPGEVLGVIQVRQELGGLLDKAQDQLLTLLLLIIPLPLLVAIGVALFVSRRLNASMEVLDRNIDRINKVDDITTLDLSSTDTGFSEFNNIFANIEILAYKLRSVAVDKDLLEFEIRLLEKFVITSEVVRDWREYVSMLLLEINKVIDAYALFAIFKVDDELFDLDVFWFANPSEQSRKLIEEAVRKSLGENSYFRGLSIHINHNIANPEAPTIDLDQEMIALQTKSLLVDAPKIGGIVGIGVQSKIYKDGVRMLVLESILSTLLNVVGSVKAIYKYTRDMEYYATRDPLTNLYNQRIFWELLGYEVDRACRHNYPFALLVIDMDNFKSINDTYGHSIGDTFLQEFATAVQKVLRGGDILARYGGDEFVMILPETDEQTTQQVAQRLIDTTSAITLNAPDGSIIRATVSIGMAMYPQHASDAKDLFLFADNMMYKAKSSGKNQLSLPSDDEVVEVYRSIGEKTIAIANAIEERRVIPFFQPIMDVASNTITAVEVLSRIELQGEILGAHEFIEIAEKQGLIHQLDYIVMEKAFEEVQRCQFEGLIFINFSPRTILIGEFFTQARHLTHHYNIKRSQVVFEITERDSVKNMDLLVDFAQELKNEGFQLAIDDFGSGFSSFHYLKRLPIDILKIEGDFVANMAKDSRDHAFVSSMTSLAKKLGIRTVAEFVENEEVLEQVRQAGIDYAQGYHIARPSPHLPGLIPALR
jgi:diguanylate cyclase (GGDEF)-like protein